MPNTSCSPSCERTRKINLFGRELLVKGYICSADGVNYRQKPQNVKLQMSVCPTAFCPANCPFCIATNTKSNEHIDIAKFEKDMRALAKENVIRGIKITGGEPFYDTELLNEVITVLFDVFGFGMEVALSTNGIGLSELHKIKYLQYMESIHLSRHHYDDDVNRRLFGFDVPTSEELKGFIDKISYKDLFVINCMLLKDYINSPEEAHKMLDYAISLGVPKVGFMGCSQVNAFAEEQHIPFEQVIREDDPSLLFTRGFIDYEYCHCRDGVYASPQGEIVEFYGRSTKAGDAEYCRGLVYGSDNHLRTGFAGEIVF